MYRKSPEQKFQVVFFFCILSLALASSHALNAEELLEATHKRLKWGKSLHDIRFPNKSLTSTQCGGIIRETNYGPFIQISYKPTQNVLPNEFCSWLVNVNQVSTYQVLLDMSGSDIEANRNCLTLTSLKKRSTTNPKNVIPNLTATNVTKANVLLVTYQTSQNVSNQKGFALYIMPGPTNDSSVSSNSVHTYFNAESFFRHPSSVNYSDYEMSTFQIRPSSIPSRKQTIFYRKLGLEGIGCLDYVAVFVFQSSSRTWAYSERFCGNVNQKVVTNAGSILLVFDSDVSVNSSGFELAAVNGDC